MAHLMPSHPIRKPGLFRSFGSRDGIFSGIRNPFLPKNNIFFILLEYDHCISKKVVIKTKGWPHLENLTFSSFHGLGGIRNIEYMFSGGENCGLIPFFWVLENAVFSCLARFASCLILISFHTGFGSKWKNFLANSILVFGRRWFESEEEKIELPSSS